MSRTSQRERLLAILSDKKWHSMPSLVRASGYRLSARVYELRRQYEIVWIDEYRKGQRHTFYRLKGRSHARTGH
jgi:hypothetical protein